MRRAIQNLIYWDDSWYHENIIQVQKKYNFRLISGLRNFENLIFGFRAYHQKTQNWILRGVLGGIFEIRECFAPQKSIFDLLGEKSPARMVTVNPKPKIKL